MFKDLREFIQALEAKGELVRIKAEVDWDEEIGAIAEEALRRDQPALLFENVKNHQKTHGRKLLVNTGLTSYRRVLMAFGLPDEMHPMEALKILKERCRQRIKPALVSKGPCKEVIEVGEKINLFEFPAPKWHPKDGGRYIVTWGAVITKDPETGRVNAGLYRGQLQDSNKITLFFAGSKHAVLNMKKYQAMGKTTMPVAIALGSTPVVDFVSCSPFPYGASEYELIGAIQQEPLEVIKCETIDLEVPATAEIVLEGELLFDPATFLLEGPFGEYPGTYISLEPKLRPVFQVKCVTHREDPILHGCWEGYAGFVPKAKPWDWLGPVSLWHTLEDAGVPGITGIYGGDCAPTSHAIIFVSIDQMHYGHAKQIASALWSIGSALNQSKIVVVVDSDVDITDKTAVLTAIAQRVRPGEDITIFPGTPGGALDPSVSPEIREMTKGVGKWDRVVIDATWPFEWKPRAEWGGESHPPFCNAREEMLEKVRQRWQEYGLRR